MLLAQRSDVFDQIEGHLVSNSRLVRWKLRYILLAQRSDVFLNQTDGHLVSNSRDVEINVHLVGSEVRCCCPRSG